MLKTIIVLPDGTELSSGVGTKNAIQNATITECVNDAQELSVGSTCANMIELTVISPDGGFSIAEGDEFTVYREDQNGIRHKVGIFISEIPTRSSTHSFSLTAYDRVKKLDKDLTYWLTGLNAWPYELYTFAKMVCEQCGVELLNQDIPNGLVLVERFSGAGITGRQIMKWVGEIAGRFCRATSDGYMEFAWYKSSPVFIGAKEASVDYDDSGNVAVCNNSVTVDIDDAGNMTLSGDVSVYDDGIGNVIITLPRDETSLVYYQGGLSFEDYKVAPIEKVQLKSSENDIGTVYPSDITKEVNTYVISDNYLIVSAVYDDVKAVAQTLYDQLKDVSYTPCKVTIPASMHIHAGDIIQITDRNGVAISAYVMTKKQAGQRDTLECTGSARRDSSSAINEQSYAALNGKVLNLQMRVDGVLLENKDTAGKLASLALNVDGLSSEVRAQKTTLEGVSQQVSQIRQDADSIKISVAEIQDNGTKKVETETGFTFDQKGLLISKIDSDIENQLDETGMYVRRKGEIILQANDDGVAAVDVSVKNYLIVGNHARFEDYTNGTDNKRTACFWL